MALGTGAVTPLQLGEAYAVFANGGYRINPYLIAKIVDAGGKVIFEAKPIQAGQESARVIDLRNAYIMDTMLRTVAHSGTGAMAGKQLERIDVAGKTGTTSDAVDGWFAGYAANIVGVAWMGYDEPKSLGSREFGATLALPIWINYMRDALKGKPEANRVTPPGVSLIDDDWMYNEYADHGGISSLGFDESNEFPAAAAENSPIHPASPEQVKQRVLNLFGVKK
jgi:penicillin-binding protein 1A